MFVGLLSAVSACVSFTSGQRATTLNAGQLEAALAVSTLAEQASPETVQPARVEMTVQVGTARRVDVGTRLGMAQVREDAEVLRHPVPYSRPGPPRTFTVFSGEVFFKLGILQPKKDGWTVAMVPSLAPGLTVGWQLLGAYKWNDFEVIAGPKALLAPALATQVVAGSTLALSIPLGERARVTPEIAVFSRPPELGGTGPMFQGTVAVAFRQKCSPGAGTPSC